MNTTPTPSSKTPMPQTHSGQKRRLLLGSSCLILALAVFLGWFYLQHRAAAQNASGVIHSDPIPGLKEAEMAKAQWLRDKWQMWARAHQSELRTMLRSKAGDKAAFEAVWKQLPIEPTKSEAGFDNTELLPPEFKSDPGANWILRGKAVFSWGPIIKIGTKPQDGEMANRIQHGLEAQSQKDFAELHDIKLSDAATGISLWVSGRITATKRLQNPNHSDGQKVWLPPFYVEVQPPYTFLTQD